MIDRVLDWLHERRRGHLPTWDCTFDGIGRDWFCSTCKMLRTHGWKP